MFCTKCGNQVPDGYRFCDKCGAPMETNVTPNVPVNANDSVNNGNQFFQAPADDLLLDNGANEEAIGKTVAVMPSSDIGKTVAVMPSSVDEVKEPVVQQRFINEPSSKAGSSFTEPQPFSDSSIPQGFVPQQPVAMQQPVMPQQRFVQQQPAMPQQGFAMQQPVMPNQPVMQQPDMMNMQMDPKAAAKANKEMEKARKKEEKAAKKAMKANANAYDNANGMTPNAYEMPKKKNTGLKVFIAVMAVLVVLAGTLTALWFLAVPKSVKTFIALNSALNKQEYSDAMTLLEFTEESLAENIDDFSQYAEENITSELNIGDLFNKEFYVYDNDDNQIELTFNDETEKFNGDVFTYSFKVMEPLVASGNISSGYDEKTVAGFRDEDKYTYKFNAVLGGEFTTYTNNVEVTLELDDGKATKISSISCESFLYDANEFAHLDGNTLYFDALEVDEEALLNVAYSLADIENQMVDYAVEGATYDEFIEEFGDLFVPDTYEEVYDEMVGNARMYEKLGYTRTLVVDSVSDIDLYHVGDNSVIFTADLTREEYSTLGGITDTPTQTYILIRPEETGMKIVFNYGDYEYVSEYAGHLDEGMNYIDAWNKVVEENDLYVEKEESNNYSNVLDDYEIGCYIDALTDYATSNSRARFFLIDRTDYDEYPILVCASGDSSTDQCKLYQYDPELMDVYSYGQDGSNGKLWYSEEYSVFYFESDSSDYNYFQYYWIEDLQVISLIKAEIDSSGSKTVYMIDGETVSESKYIELTNEVFELVPSDTFGYIAYANMYDITNGNLIAAFY